MADLHTRPARKFKVVLLGEGRVGKTSILLRYIKGEYTDQQVSTLQASYLDKRMMVENKRVQLSVWDTAGQERFHALGPIYYRDADGAVLVYDITDDESFRKVRTWVKELRRIVGDDIDILIAGNKSDLHRNRKVNEEEAVEYAQSVNATHFSTSAKLNRGLEDVFVDLTKRMLRRKTGITKKGKTSALIADDEEDMEKQIPHSSGSLFTQKRSHSFAKAPPRSTPNMSAELSASSDNIRSRGLIPRHPSSQAKIDSHTHINDDGLIEDQRHRSSMSGGLRVRGIPSTNELHRSKSNCC